MKLKSGVLVCAISVALFASVGYGAWQAKQKISDQSAASDENPPSHDVTSEDGPDVSEFPASWPAPLARPSGTPEEVATALAKKVLAGGADTLPALERAALESGFSIHDCETNAILFSPSADADNGLSMANFDLFVAAEGAKRKNTSAYASLQADIEKDLPDFPLSYYLPHVTIEGVYSPHPGYRFFGNFIMQLGMQSKSEPEIGATNQFRMPPTKEYSAVGQDSKTELSEPQLCFLLYMAAGQAWVGTEGGEKKTDKPAEEPGVPPAEDPPPHGPLAVAQGQALDAAFRNLQQAVPQLTNTSVAQAIIHNGNRNGQTPQSTLLGLARDRILQVGTKIRLQIKGAPLVRNKFYGQTGGTRPLFVSVSFSVPDSVRKKYDALRRFARRSNALPNNGPQDVTVELDAAKSVLTVKPETVKTNGGIARADLIGAPQKQHLPTYPLVNDYDEDLTALVPSMENPRATRIVSVPIRDWLPTGVQLIVGIRVNGTGRIDLGGDNHLYWGIDRMLIDAAILPETLPLPMISTNLAAPGSNRFTSWTAYFNPTTGSADPDPKYEVDDFYIYDGPVIECGVDATRGQSVENVKSLPWKGNSNYYNSSPSIVEWDSKNKNYNFKRWFRKVPTEKWRDGVQGEPRDMSMLEDIDIPVAAATGNVPSGSALNEDFVNFMAMPEVGAIQPKTYKVKTLKGGTGNDTVTVEVQWMIRRPGSNANGGGGKGGKQPPLSLAEQQALRAKVQEMLAMAMPKRDSSESAIHWPDFRPTLATPARAAHGPLWASDPSAATCAEIDVSDRFPPSVSQK